MRNENLVLVICNAYIECPIYLNSFLEVNYNMKIQIIQDDKGKPAGVFIPIEQWNKLRKKYSELDDLELKHSNTEQILEEFKEAMMELKNIEAGELKARPVKELLDEL